MDVKSPDFVTDLTAYGSRRSIECGDILYIILYIGIEDLVPQYLD